MASPTAEPATDRAPPPAQATGDRAEQGCPATIRIGGVWVPAKWLDGDTLKYQDPDSGRQVNARLEGFNTLESYGPVHQWGDWSAAELAVLAAEATSFARSRGWRCQDTGRSGGYGRQLFSCPDLARALLERGYAHVFSLGRRGAKSWLAWQRAAQTARLGIGGRECPLRSSPASTA